MGIPGRTRIFVEGDGAVKTAINKLARRAENAQNGQYAVQYGGDDIHYAVFVHEDLGAFHSVGQAKFLEEPARKYKKLLQEFVRRRVRAGATVRSTLQQAARKLLALSKPLVPVKTGALKDSGKVVREK